MPTKKIQMIGSLIPNVATEDANGLMSSADRIKLDSIETNIAYINEDDNETITEVGSENGGVSSWNDLTDKPFGTTGGSTLVVDTQELNEKINAGTAVMDSTGVLTKISDAIIIMDDLVNGLSATASDGEVLNLPYNRCSEIAPGVIVCGDYFVCVSADAIGIDINGGTFHEAGIYLFTEMVPSLVPNITSLTITIPDYTGFTVVKTLDPKYLPKITLGLHTDGLLYIFVDGSPVGSGIELPSGSTT